jgi:hypothetical protein
LFGHLARNVAEIPVDALPALDWIGVPLAAIGLALLFARRRHTAVVLLASLLLGWLVMILFQVKPRFFLSQAPLLLPLGAIALPRLGRIDLRPLLALALAVAAFRIGHDMVQPPRIEKIAERRIGEWLHRRGIAQGELVTDLPRIAFYAGLHPPPPADYGTEDLRRLLLASAARIAVLGAKHAGRRELLEELSGQWQGLPLPPDVAGLAGVDRLVYCVRR